jgi:hypothetical protein
VTGRREWSIRALRESTEGGLHIALSVDQNVEVVDVRFELSKYVRVIVEIVCVRVGFVGALGARFFGEHCT